MLTKCTCLQTVAWIVASMDVQVYMCTHAWQFAQNSLQLQVLFTSRMVYWILPSLWDGIIQHSSSLWVTGIRADNISTADLCLLLISALLCEYLPFSSLVNCSNTLSRAIFKSVDSNRSILLFCLWWRYTTFKTRWKDSRNIFVFTTMPTRKHEAHCSNRLQ